MTGREVAVQEAFTKKPEQILHVLPYFVSQNERWEYNDPKDLLTEDQRQTWWQKYGQASQKPYNAMPDVLIRDSLTEITAQPLLNYLVALGYVQGKLMLSEETNLNTIYGDLLDAVYERGCEGQNRRHLAIGDLAQKDFVRVLEEIALAAWHGDGRTTTVKEIEDHCTSSGLKQLLEIFGEGAKAGVTRLLAAFYFRQSGVKGNERTFEFTHKSFGEYLTARRISRRMERIHKQLQRRQEDMEEGWDEREALLHWAEICGPTRLDIYLLQFLRDEVALREADQVAAWQQTFAHLIGVMLRQGLPMERIEPPLRFFEMRQWAIYAEEALLAALSACALVTQDISPVDWPNKTAFGSWLIQLQRVNLDSDSVIVLAFLNHSLLEEANLFSQDLKGANLEEANLKGANLNRANLERANLEGADPKLANLNETNLGKVNLDGANLRELTWNNDTNCDRIKGLEYALNVPEDLKQKLGLSP